MSTASNTPTAPTANVSLNEYKLPDYIVQALQKIGYETLTPVQKACLPPFMAGRDALVRAQTGTGKTAGFALPVLAGLDLSVKNPQALVLAPTRELAIQVAEAFGKYAQFMPGFKVVPIYGGQEYPVQLRALKRGVHVVVGTPGRVMDHLRRGTLVTSDLKTVVLDEADEMLRMGFVEDIEWILEQITQTYQLGLFSATMPASIRKICDRHLKNPETISIEGKKATVDTIEQTYVRVANKHKLDVLTRFLEVEDVVASVVFVRTKNASTEISEKLQSRGYAAAALNGDMNQSMREKMIERFKNGSLDVIVATDLAARGIDVKRVTHVFNYDIPSDSESYVHRVGRTGRAGKSGKAILFVTAREERLLKDIQRVTNSTVKQVEAPTVSQLVAKRGQALFNDIADVVNQKKGLRSQYQIIERVIDELGIEPHDVAATLAYLLQKENPLPAHDIPSCNPDEMQPRKRVRRRRSSNSDNPRPGRGRAASGEGQRGKPRRPRTSKAADDGVSSRAGSKRRRRRS